MEQNKFLRFAKAHWQKAVCILAILSAGLFWTERKVRSTRVQAQKDFLNAGYALAQIELGHPIPDQSVVMVEEILERHPELHAIADGLVAQSLIAQGNPEKALLYAKNITSSEQPHFPNCYSEYAKITQLISADDLPQAFVLTRALQDNLDEGEHELLFAFNLLRQAFLARALENPAEAMVAWEAFRSSRAYDRVSALFQEGNQALPAIFDH